MTNCIMCSQDLHVMCGGSDCTCTHNLIKETNEQDEDRQISDVRPSALGRTSAGRSKKRGTKRDAALKDHQSTGRKRAAQLYPLDRDAPCEWQNYSNCGGGSKPILGCLNGKQQARHHGPDKTVTNNEEGNVHRICNRCHAIWHVANDPDYDWNATQLIPHAPVGMTKEQEGQAVLSELKFLASKKKSVRD